MLKNVDVEPWLEKLEEAIDLDWEREKLARWKRLLDFEAPGCEFPVGVTGPRPSIPNGWPAILINDAIRDPRKMLLRELGGVWDVVRRQSARMPNIRCNYGTGILPSVLGAELFWMDDAVDILPTARAGEGDVLGRLLSGGDPALDAGQGAQVFETLAYFKQTLVPYPRIREAVWLYHPDLQGPLDVLEMVVGGTMFTAFYDRPDDVLAALDLVTRTYERFIQRWFEAAPECIRDGYTAHWGWLVKGALVLRDDSLVNLSPAMHAEFVKPFDDRLLAPYGGFIHYCGKADHCVEKMADSPRLTAVNVSQPHLNDMPMVLEILARRRKLLYVSRHPCLKGLDLSRGVALS